MSDSPTHAAPSQGNAGWSGEMSLADVTESLFARFEGQLSLTSVVCVVRRCRRELDSERGAGSPGMIERLAGERLTAMVDSTDPGSFEPSAEAGHSCDGHGGSEIES